MPGAAGNRGLCNHETFCMRMKLVDEQTMDNGNTAHDYSMGAGDGFVSSEDEQTLDEQSFRTDYTSQNKRTFFACKSDEMALSRLMIKLVCGIDVGSSQEESDMFLGFDRTMTFPHCKEVIIEETRSNVIKRRAELYTLMHGTFTVEVLDGRCKKCESLIPYDGVDDALF